jgi:imidazole glycerol-phosphate synthase subunit HisF
MTVSGFSGTSWGWRPEGCRVVMVKIRLIPCLLLKNGLIVRSEKFTYHQIIGDPTTQVERYNTWRVDELIYLDISRDDDYDVRRSDAKIATAASRTVSEIIAVVSKVCFMPLTFGGRVRSLEDIRERLSSGADKVTINTLAIEQPGFITDSARRFGSQCIVVSIDAKRHEDGRHEVFTNGGQLATGLDPVAWAREAERLGAGEIFLNSIDRDGTGRGYDLELVRRVSDAVGIPVIVCGGVGKFQDFTAGAVEGRAAAVAAANIFHFTEMSYKNAKKAMVKAGVNVRA